MQKQAASFSYWEGHIPGSFSPYIPGARILGVKRIKLTANLNVGKGAICPVGGRGLQKAHSVDPACSYKEVRQEEERKVHKSMFIRIRSEGRTEMMVWQEELKNNSPPQCSLPYHPKCPTGQSG